MGFFRQKYWSGLPFPSPEDLPNPGIKPGSAALQADSLLSEPSWKPVYIMLHLIKLINAFIYDCTGPSLLHGFSLVAASGDYSLLQSMDFSLPWLLSLWSGGSRHTGFSSCSSQAVLLHDTWDLPGPGTEPMSSALAGGFFTTEPPGKSLILF